MSTRYYVLSAKEQTQTVRGRLQSFQRGEVLSSHTAEHTAYKAHGALDAGINGWLSDFIYLASDEPLTKGECYPELLERWITEAYDRDAIATLVSIMAPDLHGAGPRDKHDSHVYDLERLDLSLDALKERYQQRAQAEIDRVVADRQQRAEQQARLAARGTELVESAQEHTYSFPGVRGVQAGKEYYIAQVPFNVLVKLFTFDDEDVPAELRAQRTLNVKRAQAIADYMLGNTSDYVLPAITASVSQEMRFDPVALPGASDRLGMLNIPITATMLINDGQHRRAGIERAVQENPALRHETVAVVIFYDEGLARAQQMFSDINARQVKPSSALNATYDQRNPFNAWVKKMLEGMPELRSRIDFENASVSGNSHKLWSLVAFKKFVSVLTGVRETAMPGEAGLANAERFVRRFLDESRTHIPQWGNMLAGLLPAKGARTDYVIAHAVWLEALAVYGNRAVLDGGDATRFNVDGHDWPEMVPLCGVDPHKSAAQWQGRCVSLGRMQRTSDGVKLTAAALFELGGKRLPADLQEAEDRLKAA